MYTVQLFTFTVRLLTLFSLVHRLAFFTECRETFQPVLRGNRLRVARFLDLHGGGVTSFVAEPRHSPGLEDETPSPAISACLYLSEGT